jgi:3-phenylpropionate/trans-cinnamate dioxygenase ferredoxin reductase subunit
VQTRYLILGAGPAGAWAVRGIRQEDKLGKIVIVGAEPYRTYSLPLLTKGYIQGRFGEDALYLVKEDFFDKNGAIFIKGRHAVRADFQEKKVTLDDGAEINYEKLLISTGGRPKRFDVPGGDLEGIFYLRTLADSNQIKKAAHNSRRAVVIGGSFIGVELAVALREIGVPVKLIMMEKYVWQTLIPEPQGNYLMEKLVEGGIEVFPNEKVVEFEGKSGIVGSVKTESGKTYEGGLVGVGIGLDLNIDFLKGTDISVERGVRVNEFLETNIDGVYAAGDLAEFDDLTLGEKHLVGHIENAQFQGRVAGRNMAGAKISYSQVTGYDSAIFDIPLIFIGALEFGQEYWVRGKPGEPPVGSFAVRDGRIVGAFLIKPGGKEVRAVRELIQIRGIDIRKHENELKDPNTDLEQIVKGLR